jgi:hypothetical protein
VNLPTSDTPDPNVRYDIGGWISGPMLSAPAGEDEHPAYFAAIAAADEQLEAGLAALRRREDAGEIRPAEAAAERVHMLEHHLELCRQARLEHLGGS